MSVNRQRQTAKNNLQENRQGKKFFSVQTHQEFGFYCPTVEPP